MTRTNTSIYAWPLDKPMPRSLHELMCSWPHNYYGVDANHAQKPKGHFGAERSKVYHKSHMARQRRYNKSLCSPP